MGLLRSAAAAGLVVLVVGCAARTPPVTGAELAEARVLRDEGCFDCLIEARAIYERAVAAGRPATATQMLFEVNLLLALRAKELTLDPADAMGRARALVPLLPAAADAARFVALVDVVAPDERGEPKVRRGALLEAMMKPEFRARSLGWVAKAQLDPVVTEYVGLAVECVRPTLSDRSLPPAASTAPIVTFRRAICPTIPDASALEALQTAHPRFVEARLFLARAALFGDGRAGAFVITSTARAEARTHLEAVAARFGESPAVHYELGVLAQIDADLRRAAGHYGDTLARRPDHEDARLSRATVLTYLNEPERAIEDATTLIDAGTYNRGEAFYWRAFNRHRQKDLTAARADIDQARALVQNSRIFTLAGMIEYDQKELEAAERDLVEAARLDASNCVARWYLGVVRHAGEKWVSTGEAFAGAARCYENSAAIAERARAEMVARTDLEEAFRSRQIAGFEAAIKEDRSQESAAALNAAIGYARGGDRATAERYIDQAAKDPARKLTAEDLRQVMRGPQ